MSMIDIVNVINISVSTAPSGIAPYSINNVACFTKDTPVGSFTDAFGVYSNPTDVATDWGSSSGPGVAATNLFAQSPNPLTGGGRVIVIPMVGDETLEEAIARTKDLVYYGALSYDFTADAEEVSDAITAAKAARKLVFVVSDAEADITTGGALDLLRSGALTNGRGLYYSVTADKEAFKWGYAGRAMSTNFSGSNTTSTMNLKQIAGTVADTGVTSTILAKAKAAGVDVYVNIAGRSSLLSHGANQFFDYVYNLNWFVGALEVGGFNQLAQTSTKIPQTEAGMDILKGAYRRVCEQAVKNGFIAPGTWTASDRFGNPEDFDRNILERGYYIYSAPVSEQLPEDREARESPLIQIAVKTAGAIHTSSVIIAVNK
jgi:hypothetical protein